MEPILPRTRNPDPQDQLKQELFATALRLVPDSLPHERQRIEYFYHSLNFSGVSDRVIITALVTAILDYVRMRLEL